VVKSADQVKSSRDSKAAALLTRVATLETELETDAASASPREAARLRALASTIKRMTARLGPPQASR
jgi:hypothetical protein